MIIGLGISTPEITFPKESVKTVSLKDLKPGQLVRAKVMGMISDTKAQLLISGQKVTAGTDLPLTQGQEIQLKLIREKGLLTFKLIQSPPQPTAGPREGISLARVAGDILSFGKLGQNPGPVLGEILDGLALKSGDRDEAFLPRLLKNSGQLLEKKIATLLFSSEGSKQDSGMQQMAKQDLKAALLHLFSRDTGDAGGKSIDPALAKTVASALENFQTLNTQNPDTQRFILPFPILAGDQFNFGQLLIDTGKKEGGNQGDKEDRVTRLAFLLDMTSLGSLRADFSILKKTLAGRFLLEDQAACDYMTSLMPQLGQRLLAIGYQMGRVDCQVAESRQLSPGALIQSMTDDKEVRGLNLVI